MLVPWREYQEKAAVFFRSLGLDAGVDQTLQGVRSIHKIDVLVTFEKWGMNHTWIVDCKMHERPVNKSYVETIKSIVSETGASLGFLLSENGFQSGAFEAANKTNIVLSSLDELKSKSHEDILKNGANALEVRALELIHKLMHEYTIMTHRTEGSISFSYRTGVDAEQHMRYVGFVGFLLQAFNELRLGNFPIVIFTELLSDPPKVIRCQNLGDFVSASTKALAYAEDWCSKQNPG